MAIKQISVFVENKPGRLADITGFLADGGISIRAFSIADTTDFGILRLIVSDTDKAAKVLKEHGFHNRGCRDFYSGCYRCFCQSCQASFRCRRKC